MAKITIDEAKHYLRVEHEEDDELIEKLIDVSYGIVEKYTGRVLEERICEVVYDEVGDSIELRKTPLKMIQKIELIDETGAAAVVNPTNYIVDTSGLYGRIKFKTGFVLSHRNFASVVITFTAGYDELPYPLRQAILLILAILYESRGEIDDQKITATLKSACGSYRILRF